MGNSVTLTSEEASAVAGMLGISFTALALFSIVLIILSIVARWKIFSKAGERGWKSLIPIYSDYVQWRIGWKKIGLFWLVLILVVAGFIAGYSDGSFVVDANYNTVPSGQIGIFGTIGAILIMVAGILQLVAAYKLFASFGHGAGWFIGYLFIPHIMMLVLGFGSSRYFGARD